MSDGPSLDRKESARTISLVLIAVIAVIFAFYLGREFFQPIAIAVVLNALLRPVVRAMERARINTWFAATIVVLALLTSLVLAVYMLAGPVQGWMDTAPARLEAAQQKLERLKRPMQQVNEVANKIEQATAGPTSQPAAAPAPVPQESAMVRYFGGATWIVGGLAEVMLLLYLLLGMGDRFLQKLLKIMPNYREKSNARQVVHDVEVSVARYMLVTLMINIGQGIVVAIAMKLLGMPSWWMWGLLTIVLEFVPYLGAALMIVLLSISAFTQFDSIGHVLSVPGAYLLITNIQNNVVSPLLYGNHLRLNPVAVLIGVLLWWFLWGIPGAFVAVPILAAAKIIADRVESLKPVGEFLGD